MQARDQLPAGVAGGLRVRHAPRVHLRGSSRQDVNGSQPCMELRVWPCVCCRPCMMHHVLMQRNQQAVQLSCHQISSEYAAFVLHACMHACALLVVGAGRSAIMGGLALRTSMSP